MASALAKRRSGYTHDVTVAGHDLVLDEPESAGGADEGPSPTALLAAALASCTAITVEMYADRKGWELPGLQVGVEAEGEHSKGSATYAVTLHLPAGLDSDQVDRLETIAGKCPVHKALAHETPVAVRSAQRS